MFVRRFSGVAWIHFKGKFQKKNLQYPLEKLLNSYRKPKMDYEGPLTQTRLSANKTATKPVERVQLHSAFLGDCRNLKRSCFLL